MIRLEKPNVDRRLRGVLEELGTGCNIQKPSRRQFLKLATTQRANPEKQSKEKNIPIGGKHSTPISCGKHYR
ncbi:hypothetical protein TNCV_3020531 [Trichonephila clavipes]|nr:hypothetical protein TNCV_3020531 [Trichonephila clavipes]